MITLFELPNCTFCEEVKKIIKCDQILKVTSDHIKKYSLTEVPTVIVFDGDRIVYYLTGLENIKRFFSKGNLEGVPPSV